MTLLQIIVLSLIQGLTEFLPVSSSAHLILGSQVFGWPDQGLVFDVATHLGTLLAVLVYFRRDLAQMAAPWLGRSEGEEKTRRLGLILVLASVPAIVAGGLLHSVVESSLRDIRVIAFTTIGFGLLLWWADARFARHKDSAKHEPESRPADWPGPDVGTGAGHVTFGDHHYGWQGAGFRADSAARFSFLLSIPVIAAAGGLGVAAHAHQ